MQRRALISVSDKNGIVEFAKGLEELGYEIVSTGGTARVLKEAGIAVTGVSDITGFPECLDGRVKTLHPNIHAGLLAMRDNEGHMKQIKDLGIKPIDLVAINLYPFKQTIQKPGVSLEEAIENIDIGGPTMLRAAAKNYQDVAVVVDPADYGRIIEEIKKGGEISTETKFALCAKVFMHTAHYDALITDYFSRKKGVDFPEYLTLTYEKVQDLRYGENPHQRAAFYREIGKREGTLVEAKQLHGKELSFNNINDTNGALELLKEFEPSIPVVIGVKHTNPCGVGTGDTIFEAWQKAFQADPVSIFGGIVAINGQVDEETAKGINEIFVEIVVAPSYTDGALEILKSKKNIRILKLDNIVDSRASSVMNLKKINGGLLVQDSNLLLLQDDLKVVTRAKPDGGTLEDLLFAWKVVKHIKSNGIVLAKDGQTLGIGPGQVNRIWAVENAIKQARFDLKGSVMASDAFFPFPDCVEAAAKAGVKAIIQPGGSLKDGESIEAADRLGIAMVFTGMRHFKH
ncbi:MAG: bifunctional phosphoribosylaminoimidazolecarboxamide formyltransferase/IMP cyclohydrolase [Firmicutes bacterium]|nr:bifunctional phosphoribosylaminoimidazolecarboxamide formyltransferase/IMP cyclohydrolase [Bacillota bacterium]